MTHLDAIPALTAAREEAVVLTRQAIEHACDRWPIPPLVAGMLRGLAFLQNHAATAAALSSLHDSNVLTMQDRETWSLALHALVAPYGGLYHSTRMAEMDLLEGPEAGRDAYVADILASDADTSHPLRQILGAYSTAAERARAVLARAGENGARQ